MKPFVLIFIAVCAGVGFYAWRSQQHALTGLDTLKNNGVSVDFSLISRPILAVDSQQSRLYLIDGKNAQQPIRIDFQSIQRIVFKETPTTNKQSSITRGPDTLSIELNDGSRYRVADLPGGDNGANAAMKQFQQHHVVIDKLILQSR